MKKDEKAIYMILGIENQSDVHYAMVIKNALYDFMNYTAQIAEAEKKHRREKDSMTAAEFLSGFTKEDKLTPVITLTIYYGADKWDAPRTLYEMLSTDDETILKYIDNVHLNLLVPEEIEDFEQFKSDMKYVLEFIKNSRENEKMKNLLQKQEYKNIPIEVAKMISCMTGTKIKINLKEGLVDMCKAWEEQRQEGIQAGIQEGIQEEKINLIQKKLEKGKNIQQIADELEDTVIEIEKLIEIMKKGTVTL